MKCTEKRVPLSRYRMLKIFVVWQVSFMYLPHTPGLVLSDMGLGLQTPHNEVDRVKEDMVRLNIPKCWPTV